MNVLSTCLPENKRSFFEGLTVSWRMILKDGTAITPETPLAAGASVRVEWAMESDTVALGSFSYNGISGVEYIHFPCIAYPNFPDDGELLLPDHYGNVLKNVMSHIVPDNKQWLHSAEPQIAASEMVMMRASAVLTPKRSFLFDFRDRTWMQKRCFYVQPQPDTLLFYGEHLVPMTPGQTRYTLPCPCGITAFSGGWYEAARLYRNWALVQHRVANRKKRAAVREISCICWNRGLSSNVVPPVLKLSEDTQTQAGLSWYWWHHNPYDTDYPDFWPPREGAAAFRKAVAELTSRGNYVQAYLNGMTWDMDGSSTWAEGPDSVVVRRDGTPEAIPYNVFNHHRLGSICGTAAEFQSRLKREVAYLAEAGLTGVYLDMIGNANHRPCYHPGHGHALGGGDYHYHGYRKMIRELRGMYPDLLLSTEDCGEDFLDLMDLLIGVMVCHERFLTDPDLTPVPAYPVIYHGIMPIYGCYTFPDGIPPYDPAWPQDGRWKEEKDWLKLYPDQVFLELARQIVFGNIPTIANLQEHHCTGKPYAEVYGFLCDVVRFYAANRAFLFDGEMLREPEIVCPEQDVAFMTRTIYTKEGAMRPCCHRRKQVFASRWRSPAGDEATILANWSRATVSGTCGGAPFTIPPRSLRLF